MGPGTTRLKGYLRPSRPMNTSALLPVQGLVQGREPVNSNGFQSVYIRCL